MVPEARCFTVRRCSHPGDDRGAPPIEAAGGALFGLRCVGAAQVGECPTQIGKSLPPQSVGPAPRSDGRQPPSTFAIAAPIAAGLSVTVTPAERSASILSWAPPL